MDDYARGYTEGLAAGRLSPDHDDRAGTPIPPAGETVSDRERLRSLRITTGYAGEWERGFNAALDEVAGQVFGWRDWERDADATPPASETVDAARVDDATFMENVREARENGFDRVCTVCGVGVYDDSDMHERGCPEYVEFRP